MSFTRDTPTTIRRPRRVRFHEVAEDVKMVALVAASFAWLFTGATLLVLVIRVTWRMW